MMTNSEVRRIVDQPEFQTSFRADWYSPKTAFDLLGGRWFLEELVDQDAVDPATASAIRATLADPVTETTPATF